MATNVSLTTFDNCAVLYLQDGSTQVIDPHTEYFFQLGNMGFVTISEAADPDAGEHPPETAADFAKTMVEYWQMVWETIREEVQPEATPYQGG